MRERLGLLFGIRVTDFNQRYDFNSESSNKTKVSTSCLVNNGLFQKNKQILDI